MDLLINDDNFDDFNELVEDFWIEYTDNVNNKNPSIRYGVFGNKNDDSNSVILTIKDNTNLVKFMNNYGQILGIPKKYCQIKKINDISFYDLKNDINLEPHILYYKSDNKIEKLMKENLLYNLQQLLNE